jgi:catechol 2,3-dioxygenase-like lactoylglutathione lyase family enzyme
VAKLRHIALSVKDLDKSAKFFVAAFDMKVIHWATRELA